MEKEFNHVYNLYAVIVHEGYSTQRGHYYSYIKNTGTNMWFEYNDDVVKPVGKDLSSVRKFVKNAYILFYKKNYIGCNNLERAPCLESHLHKTQSLST